MTTPPDFSVADQVESAAPCSTVHRIGEAVPDRGYPLTSDPCSLPMTRIFTTLALLSLGLFAAATVLGLLIGDLYDHPDESVLRTRGVHMLTGTAAALAVVFVHSIVVTYFIGTSRWCKEVTQTYRLDSGLLMRSNGLKRKTFPWCVLGMLTVVFVGALGAASDPGTGRPDTASMANFHLAAAFAGLALVGWTYYRAWLNIVDNQTIINQIVVMVQQIRQQRGLDTTSKPDEATLSQVS